MTANITRLSRRLFGLYREVYAVRCQLCRWRTEAGELSTAVSLSRLHTCRNHEEAS